jgi:hypothetical protein
MSKILVATFLLLVCVQGHPQDFPPIKDGNSLLTHCSVIDKSSADLNAEQEMAGISCVSYLDGISEGFLIGATMGNTPKSLLICAPDGVTSQQTGRVVLRYLKSHPERLHEPAATLAYEALNKAFPCK